MPFGAGIPDGDAIATTDNLGGDRDGTMTFALTPFCDQGQSHELKHLRGSTNTSVLRSGLRLRISPEDRRSRRLTGVAASLSLWGPVPAGDRQSLPADPTIVITAGLEHEPSPTRGKSTRAKLTR